MLFRVLVGTTVPLIAHCCCAMQQVPANKQRIEHNHAAMHPAVAYCVSNDPAFPVPDSCSGVLQVPGSAQPLTRQSVLPQVHASAEHSGLPKDSPVDRWWNKVLHLEAVPAYPSTIANATTAHPPSLQTRLHRNKQSQAKGRQPSFDLSAINRQLAQLVQQEVLNCLELPRYTGKAQKREVKALAALYGLEPRNCGRTGITLFKTQHAGLLNQDKQAQVNKLLQNSTATHRTGSSAHNAHAKKSQSASKTKNQMKKQKKRQTHKGHVMTQACHVTTKQAPTSTQISAPPLDSSNIGSKMLVSMGWESGTGLGSAMQGQTEPVPIIRRQRLRGLGA